MATLTIAKNRRNISVHNQDKFEVETHQGPGFLSRFASSAYVWMEKYGEYKYTQTDWRLFRM
jgi:hypothetical protein